MGAARGWAFLSSLKCLPIAKCQHRLLLGQNGLVIRHILWWWVGNWPLSTNMTFSALLASGIKTHAQQVTISKDRVRPAHPHPSPPCKNSIDTIFPLLFAWD